MAFTSNGFRPVTGYTINNAWLKTYHIPSSNSVNIAVNDIVKAGSSGDALGIPDCARITGINDVPIGVVVGFLTDPNYLNQTYATLGTERYALVNTDPELLMEAQENNASAATLALSRLGTPVDVAITAVDTASGTSSMQIGSGALAGSPGMFRLQQRSGSVDNAAVGGTNTKWIVSFNVHQFKATA